MIQHYELKDYPYEELRMDFFKQKRLEAKRRLRYLEKRAWKNPVYNCIQHEKACDAADEWDFYNDVVMMLGGETDEKD